MGPNGPKLCPLILEIGSQLCQKDNHFTLNKKEVSYFPFEIYQI